MKRGLIHLYKFYINNVDNDYHYSELVRVFLNDDDFELITVNFDDCSKIILRDNHYLINRSRSNDRDTIKRELYNLLVEISGQASDWGTLTGVRPLKIALGLYDKTSSIDEMRKLLSERFLVNNNKIDLLTEIAEYQLSHIKGLASDKLGIYIGIPFCPTRCAYCSFASNVAGEEAITKYLDDLIKEIAYMGHLFKENNSIVESVYIGGGTPTTLDYEKLNRLIIAVKEHLGVNPLDIEFTIEAGRPDTITADKLDVMRKHNISRISINPQTMKDHTLKLIGREHNSKDIKLAYELSKRYDFDVINADIICGLPEENLDDFKNTLEQVLTIGANNITVHTLSVKRGSRLKDDDPEYYRRNVDMVKSMLDYAHKRLTEEGYYPYYIYKQKHQIGALENVGYCKEDKHSIYNIRIMEEKQTIVALGAGGIGKVYYPSEDRLERIPNVSNYEVYSERFDEMLERKNRYYGG